MINSKHEMWEFIVRKNPEIAEAKQMSIPVAQLERLVGVVWDQAQSAERAKNPLHRTTGSDIADFLTGAAWRR